MFRGRPPTNRDIRMEVLATVPYAQPASVRVLASDFGMSDGEMRSILKGLADFGVAVSDGETGARVVIPRRFQADVDLVALDYWLRTYETPTQFKKLMAGTLN